MGRELDQAVAEKVMGWRLGCYCCLNGQKHGDIHTNSWHEPFGKSEWIPAKGRAILPYYSTSIEAAWQVVEKIMEWNPWGKNPPGGGVGFRLEKHTEDSEESWVCTLPTVTGAPPYEEMDYEWVKAKADTAPLAICHAALKATEGEGGR